MTSHIYLMEDIPDDDVMSSSKTLRTVPVVRRKRKFQRSPEIGCLNFQIMEKLRIDGDTIFSSKMKVKLISYPVAYSVSSMKKRVFSHFQAI